MKKPKRRKPRWKVLRFRKNDHAHNLLTAAQRWIHANGGTCVVLGSIGLLNEENPFLPGTKGRYQVCIGALGRLPMKAKDDGKKS